MELRVAIVAEHASAQFGGEAILPLHYFRVLRRRNIPAWLIVHARTRMELEALFPRDHDRMIFVPDTLWHLLFWRFSKLLPAKLCHTLGFALRVLTQMAQRRVIRRLIRKDGITVIHQPILVSPKEPSMIHGVGVPVVIGPMNGGMDYPPAFRNMQGRAEAFAVAAGRGLADLMNRLLPGKRKAALLLVANERTRGALPKGSCRRVATLVENGVDLALWKSNTSDDRGSAPAGTRYVFLGRLVDWKAVDLLLLAMKRASVQAPMSLLIIGDGAERPRLERLAQELGLLNPEGRDQSGTVRFAGWMSQKACAEHLGRSDALVLPSLLECGGAVVLEAMAMGIPVIATAWGGPADYLNDTCGILVEPTSREAFIENLAAALVRLARFPQEREAMGRSGRARVVQHFDWEVKVDRMVDIYEQVVAENLSGASKIHACTRVSPVPPGFTPSTPNAKSEGPPLTGGGPARPERGGRAM